MDRWKTITMMAVAFTCGIAYTAACGGTDSAKADDSAAEFDPLPAGSSGGARAVLYLTRSAEGKSCENKPNQCCPEGFTFVGTRGRDALAYVYLDGVCLEDA